MKASLPFSILVAFFLNITGNSMAEYFSAKQSMIVFSECQKLLDEYQQLVNRLAESDQAGFTQSMGTSERLMELFINRKVLIYNDLDPQYHMSEYFELETYMSNMILWYPDGLLVSLDLKNAKTSAIRMHDEGLFSTDIMVAKKMHGNYMNQSVNTNTEELIYRIAFSEVNNNFSEFRIVGVRNSRSAGFLENNKALYALKSVKLTAYEIEKVRNDLRQVLNDYLRSLIMLGDPDETKEDKYFYRTSFLNLFPDSTIRIYNDIEEKPDRDIIPVNEYLENFRTYYPEGIKNLAVNIDSAEFGEIIPADDGSFYCYVYADKFFSGRFQNKDIYRVSTNLVFKMVFERTDNLFTGFKIGNIDRSGMTFLQSTGGDGDEQAVPDQQIRPITRKGFHLSVRLDAGYSPVVNKNISSMTQEANYHEWQIDPLMAYTGKICLDYFFNEHLGASIGAGYGHFSTSYVLDGKFAQPYLSYDVNIDPFYKHIDAVVDSTVRMSCLQFPLQITVQSNKPQKTVGLYLNAGIIASVILDATYDYRGDLSYWGQYPYHPIGADSLLVPRLGFYQKKDHEGEAGLKKFFISGTLSGGVSIPLTYFTSLQIGPVFNFTITDVAEKKDYFDIFGTKYDHKPVSLNYLGLEICIRFL